MTTNEQPWVCERCSQTNSWWATACGRCQQPRSGSRSDDVVSDEQRARLRASQLDWRGPSGRVMGHVVLERELAITALAAVVVFTEQSGVLRNDASTANRD